MRRSLPEVQFGENVVAPWRRISLAAIPTVSGITQVTQVKAAQLRIRNGKMEGMLDPLSRALASAPPEDEEISVEEEQAVAEAREWRKHNRPIPHGAVLAELGLSMADFERMGRTSLASEQSRPSH
jgi:hypothetical protein